MPFSLITQSAWNNRFGIVVSFWIACFNFPVAYSITMGLSHTRRMVCFFVKMIWSIFFKIADEKFPLVSLHNSNSNTGSQPRLWPALAGNENNVWSTENSQGPKKLRQFEVTHSPSLLKKCLIKQPGIWKQEKTPLITDFGGQRILNL